MAPTKMEKATRARHSIGRSLVYLVTALILSSQSEAQVPLTKSQADALYPQRLSSHWMRFVTPQNWPGFSPGFKIYENPAGEFFADLNESTLLPPNYDSYSVYYVDPVLGADSKDGSRTDRAFRSISKALSMPGNKRILCKPGVFDYLTGWKGYSPVGNVVVEPWDESGRVIVSTHIPNIIWNPLGNGVYSARCSTYPQDVFDDEVVDSWGNGVRFQKKSNSMDVASTPGSFFVSGKDITLKTLDGEAPDSDLLVFTNQSSGRYDTIGTLFIRNFTFRGGFKPFQCTTLVPGQLVTFVDCRFQYSTTDSDGFAMEGPGRTIAIRCTATGNYGDGFDYRHGREFVEINCSGVRNGVGLSYLDNGTTGHFGSIGITVGGVYTHNKGRNIHDVFDSKRLLLGTTIGHSMGIGATMTDLCSGASSNSSSLDYTEIWALGIKYLQGSDFSRATASMGKIWYRNHRSSAADSTENAGTIRPI